LSAEHLFLKDGSIIKGKVINETVNEVIFSDEQKKVSGYPRGKVLRVLYTELNMGKIYVQMKTGKNFRGYMVDEDQNSYTFRNIINKPEEFTVKRADVLFVAERNPSGLNGESSYTDIALNWFPPYDKMKYFNIYLKKPKDVKFVIADTSRSNSYKLTGLNSNTKYSIKVTGVDDTGTETLPSNEITISTLNRSPNKPSGLKVTQLKTGEAVMDWKPSVDPDGTIIKYKIYTLKKNKKELAGETKDTSYKISGAAVIDRVQVSAIDDMGAESETAGLWLNQKEIFSIYATPSVILPLGTFGAMGDVGYGGTASFMAQNLFTKGFALGLELGYYYIPGKNALGFSGQNIHLINLVTGAIKTGYAYKYNNFLIITPTISMGAAYMDLTYTARDYQTLVTYTEKSARGFDPMGAVSLSLDFIISSHFLIGINASYGLIFETKNVFQYLTFGLNIGGRF
jgi:fibronectin type 3 domain-containing protein